MLEWSPFKNNEKCLYFILKALFALDIFTFFSSCFRYAEKWLEKKAKVITSKFMTSQTEQQIITIHILPNISRSQGNQTTTFGQLTEYNIRNILLEISYTKCGGEASTRLIYKESNIEQILGLTIWNVRKFVFIACPS